MPYKSKAQAKKFRVMEAQGELPPGTASEWAHHTPDIKALPEHVGDGKAKKKTRTKEGTDPMTAIAGLAKEAADNAMIEKLAADTQITPNLARYLASTTGLSVPQFVKAAYSNPTEYTVFLKLASGAVKPEALTKSALVPFADGGLIGRVLKHMASGAQSAGNAVKGAVGAKGAPEGGMFGKSEAQGGIGKAIQKMTPTGESQAGRIATGTGIGGAGAFVGGSTLNNQIDRRIASNQAAAPKPEVPGAQQAISGMAGQGPGQGGQPQPKPPAPSQTNGPAANPQAPPQGGMGSGSKALLAAGGVGLGAMGVGALVRRRKQRQQQKEGSMKSAAVAAMRSAIVKKAAAAFKTRAVDSFCSCLDAVALAMPIEKTAAVRTIQKQVASGQPLSFAIKAAFPHLTGEQRGIVASDMVRLAAGWGKKANSGCAPVMPTMSPQSWSGPMVDAQAQMSKMGGESCSGMPSKPVKTSSRKEATVKAKDFGKAMRKMA